MHFLPRIEEKKSHSERTNTKNKEEEDKLSTATYFDRDGAESLKR
jgi:hypothetical protein